MPNLRRVAVYGNTVALAGIALALERHPALQVVTLEAQAADLVKELQAHSPGVIVFDVMQTDPRTILTCAELCGDLLAIGIQANSDRMLLWSGQHSRAVTIRDLIDLVDTLPGSSHPPACLPALSRLRHLATRGMARIPARQRKLIFALAGIGMCVVLALGLLQLTGSNTNALLVGTAAERQAQGFAGQPQGFTGQPQGLPLLAFAAGVVLGGTFFALWFHEHRHNQHNGR